MYGIGYSGRESKGTYADSSYQCDDVGLLSCSGGVFTGKDTLYASHY